MSKTVTFQTPITPGLYNQANVSVSEQGAVTAITTGNNFLNIDSGVGSYTVQPTDRNIRVFGSSLFFVSLPDTNLCYAGQQFTIWTEMDDITDYQIAYPQVQVNDGTVITKLNYKNATATFTVITPGDNSPSGWSYPFVQDYIASATINNATTFTNGSTISWDTILYNTEQNNSGLLLFDSGDNGMHIRVDGWYQFDVKFLCQPGAIKCGILLSQNGNKTVVSSFNNSPTDWMTYGFSTTQLCKAGDTWDVRAWDADLDSIAGQQWYYQFICRRVRN